MHRVSISLHASKKQCVNILSNIVLIVLLFQENKSFGASYHLHSSSDVREAVSGTINSRKTSKIFKYQASHVLTKTFKTTPF
jgi:hypothetical protein